MLRFVSLEPAGQGVLGLGQIVAVPGQTLTFSCVWSRSLAASSTACVVVPTGSVLSITGVLESAIPVQLTGGTLRGTKIAVHFP